MLLTSLATSILFLKQQSNDKALALQNTAQWGAWAFYLVPTKMKHQTFYKYYIYLSLFLNILIQQMVKHKNKWINPCISAIFLVAWFSGSSFAWPSFSILDDKEECTHSQDKRICWKNLDDRPICTEHTLHWVLVFWYLRPPYFVLPMWSWR